MNEVSVKQHYLIHALMLLAMLLIASSFNVGASIAESVPPSVLMLLRFSLAAVLFAPFVFLKYGFKVPGFGNMRRYALLSLPLVIFFWCMFESLRYTSALNTGALYTLVPAITAFYAWMLNKERVDRKRLFGLALGTFGALWIVFRGEYELLIQLELNKGDLIFVVGCMAMGLYTPLVKRSYQGEPVALVTFWVTTWGGFWLFLISFYQLPAVEWDAVDTSTYLGVIYLALFTTLVTFFLLQFATVHIGATKVAAYSFLTPVFVLFISLFMGELFSAALLPGLFFVVFAMLLIQSSGSGNKAMVKRQSIIQSKQAFKVEAK